MQFRFVLAAVAAFALAGCTREVASGLDESDANRAVVALARGGVDAEKIADANAEGRFRIVVQRDDATTAITILAGEDLPRRAITAPKESSIVSSPEAERAARVAAIAAQVERTLGAVDGVLDARVLLDVPNVDPLSAALAPAGSAPPPRSTASVLVRHRGTTPPITVVDVQRLVAGGVSGLDPKDVAVVLLPVSVPAVSADRQLAYLGPIAVSRASLPTARIVAIVVFVLFASLAAVVVLLAMRLRRQKEAAESAPPAPAPQRAAR